MGLRPVQQLVRSINARIDQVFLRVFDQVILRIRVKV